MSVGEVSAYNPKEDLVYDQAVKIKDLHSLALYFGHGAKLAGISTQTSNQSYGELF